MLTQVQNLIRTYVAIVVGVAITALTNIGVHLDTSTQAALLAVATGLTSALYATVVHLLERRWPALGNLLGTAMQASPTATPVTAVSAPVTVSQTIEAAPVPAPSSEAPTAPAAGAAPNSTGSAG